MKPKQKLSITPHNSRLNAASSPWVLALALCASPLALAADSKRQSEWLCRPDGSEWSCSQQPSVSPAYKRPKLQTLPVSAAKPQQARTAAEQDWVAAQLLTPEQQALVEALCCNGLYLPPARSDAEADQDPEKSPARITPTMRCEIFSAHIANAPVDEHRGVTWEQVH